MAGASVDSSDPVIKHSFHIGDYVVFSLTIVVSLCIGIFYAVTGRKRSSTAEYLVGGRAMSFIPTTISLMVSFESSIMMLGLPAEVYVYGLQIIWWAFGMVVSQIISVHVIVPLLHPLRITSAYEYLELRFQSRAVRLMGTVMGILTYVWYMGIVLFGPAVALEAVTNFDQWSSILVISIVSVIYTSIGGMKAVIWTDVFQALVMFMGIFSILIKGTIDAGGPKAVWDTASAAGRMNFFNFDPDPRVRHTFWNLAVGAFIRGFGLGFNQSTVQRISSTRSLGDAKRMLLLVAPCFLVSLCLASYEGVVAFAYYQTKRCDPIESEQITDPNQLIPYLVMDIFARLPGMPGLFLASLFSASLSTLSSGLSSLAALTWADILKPLLGDISEFKATIILKITVVIYGGLAIAVAMCVAQIGGVLTQIASSLISAFGGPLTGIFFLACFFPRCKAKGCIIGGVTMMVFCTWIAMGMSFSPNIEGTPYLEAASTDNCYGGPGNSSYAAGGSSYKNISKFTDPNTEPTTASTGYAGITHGPEAMGVEALYTISYQWIGVIGIVGTVVLGNFISILTGANKPGDVDPRYLISMTDTILICLPTPVKSYISSCGPQFMEDKYKAKFKDPAERQTLADMETDIAVITDPVKSHQRPNSLGEENGVGEGNPTITGIPQATVDLERPVVTSKVESNNR